MSRRRETSQNDEDISQEATNRRQSDRETMLNLKKFVKEMQQSKGRAVEMRLAVLCGIAVGLRVFYSPIVSDSIAASGVIFFILSKNQEPGRMINENGRSLNNRWRLYALHQMSTEFR